MLKEDKKRELYEMQILELKIQTPIQKKVEVFAKQKLCWASLFVKEVSRVPNISLDSQTKSFEINILQNV